MRFVDVGDNANRRLDVFGKFGNLSKPAHTDFDDGGFVIRVEFKQRQRYADFVVEVRRSLEHVTQLRQRGGGQVFGRGLAVGTGDSDNRDVEAVSPTARDLSVSSQRVVNFDDNAVNVLREIFADEYGGGTFLERVGGKVFAVEAFTFERDEQHTRGDFAAVGGDAVENNFSVGIRVRARHANDFRQSQFMHWKYLRFR